MNGSTERSLRWTIFSGMGGYLYARGDDFPNVNDGIEVAPVAEVKQLREELENVRNSLCWALTNVPEPKPTDGEYAEDHGGATRLAYPDNPENWS